MENQNGKRTDTSDASRPGVGAKIHQSYSAFVKRQGMARFTIFFTGLFIGIGIFHFITWKTTKPPADPWSYLIVMLTGLAIFLVGWPLTVFKWRKIKLDNRKITMPKCLLWMLVTGHMCFFVSTACAGPTTGDAAPNILQNIHVTTTATTPADITTTAKPKLSVCELVVAVLVIVAVGYVLYAVWRCACVAGLNKKTGDQGTNAPASGDGNNIIVKGSQDGNVNPLVELPSTQFYFSNGVMTFNNAGLAVSQLPAFVSVNGHGIPFGQLNPDPPIQGQSTPATIAFWAETNQWVDPVLDPNYPYIALFNYSLVTTTNMVGTWGEVYTIIGWANADPIMPLIQYVTYTNSVPFATNWAQAFFSYEGQLTNVVVYGKLPNVINQLIKGAPQIKYNGTDPTNPTNICTNCPPTVFNSSGQFFKLIANTNTISTGTAWADLKYPYTNN